MNKKLTLAGTVAAAVLASIATAAPASAAGRDTVVFERDWSGTVTVTEGRVVHTGSRTCCSAPLVPEGTRS